MIRVSVIIPAYNAEAFIARAVDSALAQTETSLEILVVDDASTDGTAALVEAIAASDPRVRLIRSAVNGGPGVARNLGLEAAQGRWIALLDADDSYLPQRLETLIALAEANGADLVSDNLLLIQEDGSAPPMLMIPSKVLPAPKRVSPAEFIAGNIGSRTRPRISYGFMAPVFRREFRERHAIRYNAHNRFGEDYMLAVGMLMAGGQWWITPEPLYRYSVRKGSLTEVQSSADLQRIRQMEAALLRDHPRVAADPVLARELRRHKAVIDRCYYYRAFTDALKSRAFGEATRLLVETPSGFRHIVTESAAQLPLIAAKALRGGYARRTGAPRTQPAR